MEEADNIYMVKQYYGYCQYLRECMDDAQREWEKIRNEKDDNTSNNDKNP